MSPRHLASELVDRFSAYGGVRFTAAGRIAMTEWIESWAGTVASMAVGARNRSDGFESRIGELEDLLEEKDERIKQLEKEVAGLKSGGTAAMFLVDGG